jgi:hypothetical protein
VKALRGLSVLVLMLLRATTPDAWAQNERVISGRVVDASTGKPIAGVMVVVSGPNLIRTGPGRGYSPPRVLTAGDGRFVFRSLPDGGFGVIATKNGYAEGAYGRRRPNGSAGDVVLSAGQPAADITIPIWKNGAISGTLTDEVGEPVVGAQVVICRASLVSGVRHFAPIDRPAYTDDRGIYRFSNLVPGDYIVAVTAPSLVVTMQVMRAIGYTGSTGGALSSAMPGTPSAINVDGAFVGLARGAIVPPPVTNGRLSVYPPTLYPSASVTGDATVITIASAEERTGVDVQVQPVATARVTGTLVSSAGPFTDLMLRLRSVALKDVPLIADASYARTDSNGQFVFPAVPLGEYMLTADLSTGSPMNAMWVRTPVSVGGDVDGVTAVLRDGLHVSGRIEYQGIAPPPEPAAGAFQSAALTLESVDGTGGGPRGMLSGSEGFRLTGFTPGQYLVRVSQSPRGWMFKSAILNGVDVSETPFDLANDIDGLVLTYTDRWNGLNGIVHDANGNADTKATVLVFPTEASRWRSYGSMPRRLKSALTNASGEFGISAFPSGEYFVVAVPGDSVDDWRDPKTLDALARIAETVTILEGEYRKVDLRTKEMPR